MCGVCVTPISDIEMDLLEKILSLTVRYTCCLNLSVVNEGLVLERAVMRDRTVELQVRTNSKDDSSSRKSTEVALAGRESQSGCTLQRVCRVWSFSHTFLTKSKTE